MAGRTMIGGALSRLAGWKGHAAAALAAGLVAGVGTWKAQAWRYDAEISRMQSAYDAAERERAIASLSAVEAARNEERRRTAAVEKAREEAHENARVAASDADSARAELGRLQHHANTLARAAITLDPSAAVGSPAGASSVDLLAYMLSLVSDRAAELAAAADRARIAGLTCERAYDSLMP